MTLVEADIPHQHDLTKISHTLFPVRTLCAFDHGMLIAAWAYMPSYFILKYVVLTDIKQNNGRDSIGKVFRPCRFEPQQLKVTVISTPS